MQNSRNPILVTGGAGFIGSNFVLDWLANSTQPVITLDALTYAGNMENLASLKDSPNHLFVKGNICDQGLIEKLLEQHKIAAIIHFAAESHVDRSIDGPNIFIETNIKGTYSLLEAARKYFAAISEAERQQFRFLHVSTDEVYGSLSMDAKPFTEEHQYQPNSPYSASKAASDHLVRAWHHTYGLPVITTNCSNNYGPRQCAEKLIPLTISNAIAGKQIPIYGDGKNIRDWLFVTDHCLALRQILAKGKVGESYNIGGNVEKTNLEVVSTICQLLDEIMPALEKQLSHPVTGKLLSSYNELMTFVKDRAGHDLRYAINSSKLQREIGWQPLETFDTGIVKTIDWYLK